MGAENRHVDNPSARDRVLLAAGLSGRPAGGSEESQLFEDEPMSALPFMTRQRQLRSVIRQRETLAADACRSMNFIFKRLINLANRVRQ